MNWLDDLLGKLFKVNGTAQPQVGALNLTQGTGVVITSAVTQGTETEPTTLDLEFELENPLPSYFTTEGGLLTLEAGEVFELVPDGNGKLLQARSTQPGGLDWIELDDVELAYSPVNYATDDTTVAEHLEGIDDALTAVNLRHRELTASVITTAGAATIDFGLGRSVTLTLDASITTLTLVAPTLESDRACAVRLQIQQGPSGGPYTITNWVGADFGEDGDPVLSTAADKLDIATAFLTGADGTMWFQFKKGWG